MIKKIFNLIYVSAFFLTACSVDKGDASIAANAKLLATQLSSEEQLIYEPSDDVLLGGGAGFERNLPEKIGDVEHFQEVQRQNTDLHSKLKEAFDL